MAPKGRINVQVDIDTKDKLAVMKGILRKKNMGQVVKYLVETHPVYHKITELDEYILKYKEL